MNKIIVLCVLYFFYIVVFSENLLRYDKDFIEYDMQEQYIKNFQYYANFSYMRDYKFEFNCDKTVPPNGLCRIDLNENMKKNLYGILEVCLVVTSTDKLRGCTTYINFPTAINVVFNDTLPTSGGVIEVTGDYLLANAPTMKYVMGYRNLGNTIEYFNLLSNYMDPTFDPRKIRIQFEEGYGLITIPFTKNLPNYTSPNIDMYKLKYKSPSIQSISYDGSTFTINGDNFYKNLSVFTLKINNNIIDNSYVTFSSPHKIITVNHQELEPIKLNFDIDVGGNSIDKLYLYEIPPKPLKIKTSESISRYSSGKVQIDGSYLSSSKNDIIVLFQDVINLKNYSCELISEESSSTTITCNLEKCDPNNQVNTKLLVIINGVENDIKNNINFTYGVPFLNSEIEPTQIESEFTLYGLNLGNLDDGSTKVFINGQDRNVEVKSIQDKETKLTFILPNTCENKVNVTIEVNGIQSTNIVAIEPKPVYFIFSPPLTNEGKIEIRRYYSCDSLINEAYIMVDEIKYDCTKNVNNTVAIINCFIGKGTGKRSIKLFVDGKEADMNNSFTYASPIIDKYYINDPKDNNINVIITGSNYGNSSSDCIIKLNDTIKNRNDTINVNCTVIDDTKITFNVKEYSNYNLDISINGTSMENSYQVKLFKIGEIVEDKSNRTSRNGYVCISGTNLPNYISNVSKLDKIDVKISKSNGQLYSSNNFTINNNLMKINLADGVGKFNISININDVSSKSISTLYNSPIIKDSYLIKMENDNSIIIIIGSNFGTPFKINVGSNNNELTQCQYNEYPEDYDLEKVDEIGDNDFYTCYIDNKLIEVKDGTMEYKLTIEDNTLSDIIYINKDGNGKGLSKGAKAGIGISVGVVGAALAVGLTYKLSPTFKSFVDAKNNEYKNKFKSKNKSNSNV